MGYSSKRLSKRYKKQRIVRNGRATQLFTEQLVRHLQCVNNSYTEARDIKVTSLIISVTHRGSRTYYYRSSFGKDTISKSIGTIYEVTLEQARSIAQNIDQNLDEFLADDIRLEKTPLCRYLKEKGYYPHKKTGQQEEEITLTPNGTIQLLSNENKLLRDKIREGNEEIEKLKKELIKVKFERQQAYDAMRKCWFDLNSFKEEVNKNYNRQGGNNA